MVIIERIRSNLEISCRVLDYIFVGCWGEIMDFMGVIIFLVSRVLDYVNGYIFVVDGGYWVW